MQVTALPPDLNHSETEMIWKFANLLSINNRLLMNIHVHVPSAAYKKAVPAIGDTSS